MRTLTVPEAAIRTADWAVPGRGARAPHRQRRDPRKFYFVFDPVGMRLGYISHSEKRPALEFGGPTYFLKRCPPPRPQVTSGH